MRQALLLIVTASCVPLCAQDMSQQMAMQQSMQATQQASADAQRANQQAMQDAQNTGGVASGLPFTARPRFSLAPGKYPGTQTVTITDSTKHASIFYTVDGWTPTIDSSRYDGPITISATTHLEAVAMAPNHARSWITTADYDLPTTAAATTGPVVLTDGVLKQGTALPLAFVSSVSSDTARIGDPIRFSLTSDVVANGTVVLPKNTEATGRIINVRRPSMGGMPGSLTFEVRSLVAHGITVPLTATLSEEGRDQFDRARKLVAIPLVNMSVLGIHGTQAEIKSDRALTATVAADVKLAP